MATAPDLERLRALGTAHCADACGATGVPLTIADGRLRPLLPFTRLAGIAVPMRLFLGAAPPSYAEQALRQFESARGIVEPVMVICNEVEGYDSLGEFDARLAVASGFVGCVTDGAVRDTEPLAKLLPVFAGSIRPDCLRPTDLAPGIGVRLELGARVSLAGLQVAPGDVVVADHDGVIGFAAAAADAVLDAAEAIERDERMRIARLEAGASLREILGLPPN